MLYSLELKPNKSSVSKNTSIIKNSLASKRQSDAFSTSTSQKGSEFLVILGYNVPTATYRAFSGSHPRHLLHKADKLESRQIQSAFV